MYLSIVEEILDQIKEIVYFLEKKISKKANKPENIKMVVFLSTF